jgi:hypothetical protein
MYLRRTTRRVGDKTYQNYLLVESVATQKEYQLAPGHLLVEIQKTAGRASRFAQTQRMR